MDKQSLKEEIIEFVDENYGSRIMGERIAEFVISLMDSFEDSLDIETENSHYGKG